jgi:putative NADH-flavin reductase
MKIVVLGGSGLIGTKLVKNLRQHGHEVVAASPSSGVNTLTGEGLAGALEGAQVVVDVTNSPSFEDKAVLEFFKTSNRNLLTAEPAAGVGHHVALSVVGAGSLPRCGYLRAKLAQEDQIKASKVPYSILRSTQFYEFLGSIVQSATDGQMVRLPPARIQPGSQTSTHATSAQSWTIKASRPVTIRDSGRSTSKIGSAATCSRNAPPRKEIIDSVVKTGVPVRQEENLGEKFKVIDSFGGEPRNPPAAGIARN